MLPGQDCMACHRFRAAGTVFATRAAGCNGTGIAGARVELMDRTRVVRLAFVTNAAGSFFTRSAPPLPYTARVTSPGGVVTEMTVPQFDGDCVHCHRWPPAGGADGRIFIAADTRAGAR